MAKLGLEEQEELINNMRKNVKYDTKEYTLEHLVSKFNLQIDENKQTEIFIPFYQRKFVWKDNRQSKFIESIILGLPIPPMYFAEVDEGVLEVIDGSQRIRTIDRFLRNQLKLKGLQKLEGLNGLTFNDLSSSRKRKINNVSMRAVVVTDIDKDTMSIRHEIFERLNTGRDASYAHKNLLQQHGIIQSMSRKGNCWDNVVAESFFHALKTELIYHEIFEAKAQANQAIFEYIEVY